MTIGVVWRTEVLYRLCRRSPGKRVCRLEQVECSVDSVDDSSGRSNVALDTCDVGCHLWSEFNIQASFGVRNLSCLINHLVLTFMLS